jgi:glycine betaine/choline ABC-type transport system substrate-binding protein
MHMQARRTGPLATLLALAALALFVAGCGGGSDTGSSSSSAPQAASAQPGKGKPAVTIGTKDFTEEYILGELYARALRAEGYAVNVKRSIGPTEVVDKALTAGKIDAYPEYTGETVATVAGKNVLTGSARKTAQLAKDFYAERGQVVSAPTPFEDVDAIGVLKGFASKQGLQTVEDLKKLPSFTLGARPEFKDRFVGFAGMKKVYGIKNAKYKQLATGLQYTALDRGNIDTANVFSTDAQLASGKYAILKDPKGVFGFQNVLFVIDKAKYKALGGPQFMAIINKVNSLLTEPAMRTMNAAVALDKQDPGRVAEGFLRANKLT